MSDNFNIRDFRNAGDEPKSEDNNRLFYSCLVAIPVIAVIAGLGYKPLMNLRGNNIQSAQVAQAEMEAERRAKNPAYALISDMRSGETIDLNQRSVSNRSKSRSSRKTPDKPLNAHDFLNRVDAKAANFTALEMETLKFTRTKWALSSCNRYDLQKFYLRTNAAKYDALKERSKTLRDEKRNARIADAEQLALPKIENRTQAIAFVATGGVGRHQKAAMSTFAELGTLTGENSKYKIQSRHPRFNKIECSKVGTLVQSGRMNIKTKI